MARLNRVRFINVGHKRSFYQDRTIDFHGESSLVVGANGTGKSTWIGLFLSLLRPRSHEFVGGKEKGKKRALSEYLLDSIPGHIIIEWIIPYKGKDTFLITGTVMTKRLRNTKENENYKIDQYFYSFMYPTEISSVDWTIASIPYQDNESIYTAIEFMKILRKKSKIHDSASTSSYKMLLQEPKTQHFWAEYLTNIGLDEEIFKIQARMNQSEMNMASILSFSTNQIFYNFLFDVFTDYSKKEKADLREVKDSYLDFKNLSRYKKEISFLDHLIEKLTLGDNIIQNYSQKKTELFHQTTFLKSLVEEFQVRIDKLNEECNFTEEEIKSLQDSIEHLKSQKLDIEKNINFVDYCTFNLEIAELKHNLEKLDEEILIHKKKQNFLILLPDIYKKKNFEGKYESLNKTLEEKLPLIERLEIVRRIIFTRIDNEIKKLDLSISSIEKNNKEIKKEFDEIRKKIDKKNGNIETYQDEIQINQEKIQRINIEEKKIKPFYFRSMNFTESLDHIESMLMNYNDRNSQKFQEKDKNHELISDKNSEIDKIKEEIANLKKEQDSKTAVFEKMYHRYQTIINHEIYLQNFPSFEETQTIQFNRLELPYTSKIENQAHDLKKDLELITWKGITHNNKITEYKRNKDHFGYNPESQIILEHLKQKFPRFQFFIGWDYIRMIKPESFSLQIIEKFGHLFDGVVVNTPDLSTIKQYLSDKDSDWLGSKITTSVFVISSQFFTSLQNPITFDKLSYLITPDLKWRMDVDEEKKRFQQLLEEFQEIEKKKENLEYNTEKIQELLKNIKNFNNEYSEQLYQQYITQNKHYKHEISTKETINNQKTQEINILEKKNKELENEIEKCNQNIIEFRDLKSKFKDFQKLIIEKEQLKDFCQIKEDKIVNLNSEINDLEIKKNTLQLKIQSIESNLQNEKEKYMQQKSDLEDYQVSFISIANKKIEDSDYQQENITFLKSTYKESYNQYNLEIEKSKLKKRIGYYSDEIKKLEDKINSSLKKHQIDLYTEENQLLINGDLTEEQIQERKNTKEQIISKLFATRAENEIEMKGKKKQFTKKKSLLIRDLPQLIEKKSPDYDEISYLKERKALFENQMKINIQGIQEQENLKYTFNEELKSFYNDISNLNVQYKIITDLSSELKNKGFDGKIETFSFTDLFDDFSELKHKIEQIKMNILEAISLHQNFVEKIERFLKTIKNQKEKMPKELVGTNYDEIFSRFNLEQIESIPKIRNNLIDLKARIESKKNTIHGRIENIVSRFSIEIEQIIGHIRKLKKITLDLPDIPKLNKIPLLKIAIRPLDQTRQEEIVRKYFMDLFNQVDEFPTDISFGKIMSELYINFCQIQFRNPTFLFLDQDKPPEYMPIPQISKLSGGEEITFGILLFCLLSSYKMEISERDTKIRPWLPLILDNPFGTVTRTDFIKLQTELARQLRIQLIIFTHIKDDLEIFAMFPSLLVMYKNKKKITHKGEHYSLIEFQVEKASISRTPEIKPVQKNLSSYIHKGD